MISKFSTIQKRLQSYCNTFWRTEEWKELNMIVKTIEIHGANAHKTFSKTHVGCRGIVIKDSRMLISHEVNADIEKNIFNSIHRASIDTLVGYKLDGVEHSFLERFE